MAESKAASASEYMQKTHLTESLQEVLNELLQTRPDDAYGELTRLLRARSLPPTIDRVVGREVLDSRGNPTVEVDVYAKRYGKIFFAGRSSAPSGASTGSNEARELRDTESPRYFGKGTLTAARNVTEELSPALHGLKFDDLSALDRVIQNADGTELKEHIGGNACTATSFALAESAAKLNHVQLFEYLAKQFHGEDMPQKFKLPTPFFNILNGGKHAGGNLKLQEFMVSPKSDAPFPDQLRMVAEVYQKLGEILVETYGVSAKNLGDEGGFAPLLNTPEEAISVIEKAIVAAGYEPGTDIKLGLDAAASEFYNSDDKTYEVEVGVIKTGEEMIQYWKDLVEAHPAVVSIEDGLHETDYENWAKLNEELGDKIQLVGDDLYTTNPNTIRKGLEGKWANALLLKVNQIGTISEAMEAARLILDAGQNVMVSHRSGETGNSLIADLAVAIGAQSIKTGSTARGERIQKYTRLLQIYEYLVENDMLDVGAGEGGEQE
ncbi:enolase family protein [Tritrichomonas foetus]|uniref:phosphopyruvate hydratase n=1 Tax=Tritrichomonas foetus TaxID=1144522 RepID=A0A1J4JMX1_9EUKA|nr:enolase family protein [Tritrichomonas foetus]OHT00471.1 enolase family protein [Tritrichomonas foetus]|eukprot:OHT00471.1 enolase family protein [Tritrichomonas foetus]